MMRCSLASTVALITFLAGTNLTFADLPNGVAAGETTTNSSLLWARSTIAGDVRFEVSTDPAFGSLVSSSTVAVSDPLQPVKAATSGLQANTRYFYRATDASGAVSNGTFKTAAPTNSFAGFRMGVSGDWRGELAPFPAVRNAAGRNLDLWHSLGDTIYADYPSPALPIPQAQTLNDFRVKHNEIYTERNGLNSFRAIRQSTSTMATIDDHEVTNDFEGGALVSSDPRFTGPANARINTTQLYRDGVQAFQEFHPMQERTIAGTGDERSDGRPDLYRTQRYGKDAAVFSLDARSFRDEGLPAVADPTNPAQIGGYLAASFTPGRTMLGNPQRERVKADLLAAQQAGTTWKFVMVPEPIQNLGVLNASDRFEGYAAERAELLRFIDQNNIDNVVFVAADIHGTLVNNLTYQNGPFQPQIESGAFEITTGSGAFSAPFGPTVAGLAAGLGLPGTLPIDTYLALPGPQQEAYIQGLINAQITPLGYNPLGLQNSPIQAQLLQGGWTATNSYGWTEFDIDAVTQQLCVTTYGIPWYTEQALAANPALIASLEPTIMQQFCVNPIPAPGAGVLMGTFGLMVARRRRSTR